MRLFEGTKFDIPPKCDQCGELEHNCKCSPKIKGRIAPEKQTAQLRTEKRKKGKRVTVVTGLLATSNDLQELLTNLKNVCGAGGTIEGDSLEIQGDHLIRIREYLGKLGFKVK